MTDVGSEHKVVKYSHALKHAFEKTNQIKHKERV